MKKFNWFLVMLLLALVPALQSCDDMGIQLETWDGIGPRFMQPVAEVIIWKVIAGE